MTRKASSAAAGVALIVVLGVAYAILRPGARNAEPASPGHPVLFVGLDGADWQLLDALVARGSMPNLAALVREGRSGVLLTEHPPLSPLLWTTMMTGLGPLEHRILDFTRFNPVTGAREPITTDERRVPAVWNMASASGKRVAVFGMWATYPAEPVSGVVVSDRVFSFQHREDRAPAGAVFPPERESWVFETLERTRREVDSDRLGSFAPCPVAADGSTLRSDAEPVASLRRILIETLLYHRLATQWLAEAQPDLAIVYFQGTDAIGHVFAPFAPPRQDGISQEDFERYSCVPERYFGWIDELLGDYRRIAASRGAVLVLASDHGFTWGEGRPRSLSSMVAATAGKWHREEGIYVLWGPGIESSAVRERAGIARVCATLLALAGLPAGRGLAGPPLPGVLPQSGTVADYQAQYEPRSAEAPAALGPSDEEDLARLRALGYVAAGEPDRRSAGGSTRTAGSWNNEGLILRAAGRSAEAQAAFEAALAADPRHASAMWNLSDLLHAEERELDRSDDLLVRACAAGAPEGLKHLVGRAVAYHGSGAAERSEKLVGAALGVRPDEPELLLFRGRYRAERGDCAGALDDAEHAARLDPRNPLAPASAGLARLCLGKPEAALEDFRRSLALDPDQPEIRRFVERGGR